MTLNILILYVVILSILLVPVFTRYRYDLVAVLAVVILAVVGIIPPEGAFVGFGHPAVITVAAVLVITRGLQNAGVVDMLVRWMGIAGDNLTLQLATLCGTVAITSAFMNNVGALAVFMPVAISMAQKSRRSPALYLMPLAFSAHFGGMMTLIGTPPNIIMATIRAEQVGEPFRMFDFLPLGLGIAIASVLFIALVGWRLVPERRGGASNRDMFEIESYLSEVHVPENSELVGRPVRDVRTITEADALIVRIRRGEQRLPAPAGFELIHAGDTLMVRADADELSTFVRDTGVELAESRPFGQEALQSDEISLVEAIIAPRSPLVHRTARNMNLRSRYGVNLLAVSRHGAQLSTELATLRLEPGDVLLLQGYRESMQDTLQELGCLPLAERDIQLGRPSRVLLATGIFGASMAAAASGLLAVQISMTLAACAMIIVRLLNLREAYASIDWPILILLGAMLPLGSAMEATGGAHLIANQIMQLGEGLSPAAMLAIVLIVTMILSDLVNNAAAVVLMAPIAIGIAQGLRVSLDPFLIAVTIGGSCAFLTPIGHQSNVLVLEPGGYEFGDYWRLGLPLELLIIIVGIPLVLFLWPL
jgi:di/tricarboxylate transporter